MILKANQMASAQEMSFKNHVKGLTAIETLWYILRLPER
jgi:hypothetical protein